MQQESLWGVEELAAYLRKPRSWVYDNYRQKFPYMKVGQSVRFDPDEIRETLKRGKVIA